MPDGRKFLLDGRPPSFLMGAHELTLEVGVLGDQYERTAAQELRETPAVVAESLDKLRQLVKDEKNLQVPYDNDNFLLIFLRPCKFYPHSAFERMKAYYKFMQKNTKLSAQLTPKLNPLVFEADMLSIMPKRDQVGRRVLLLEVGSKWKTDEVSPTDIHRAVWLALTLAWLEPRTQVAGAVAILDMQGFGVKHAWQLTPGFAFDLAHWVQECVPARLKAVHVVRQSYVFNMAFAIFKPFLKEKLRKRIHLHGTNWNSLHQHVDPSCLPRQFGGHLDIPQGTSIKLHQLFCTFDEQFDRKQTSATTSSTGLAMPSANHNNSKPGLPHTLSQQIPAARNGPAFGQPGLNQPGLAQPSANQGSASQDWSRNQEYLSSFIP